LGATLLVGVFLFVVVSGRALDLTLLAYTQSVAANPVAASGQVGATQGITSNHSPSISQPSKSSEVPTSSQLADAKRKIERLIEEAAKAKAEWERLDDIATRREEQDASSAKKALLVGVFRFVVGSDRSPGIAALDLALLAYTLSVAANLVAVCSQVGATRGFTSNHSPSRSQPSKSSDIATRREEQDASSAKKARETANAAQTTAETLLKNAAEAVEKYNAMWEKASACLMGERIETPTWKDLKYVPRQHR
jgi:hypothetical protein